MRLLAGTIFAGLALIAGSVVFYTLESPNDQWVGAEEIARAQIEALGRRPDWVRQVSGPFVSVKLGPGECYLVDVSTKYKGDDSSDSFWVAGFRGEDASRSIDC